MVQKNFKVTTDMFSKYKTLKITSLDQLHHLGANLLIVEKRCLATSMRSSEIKKSFVKGTQSIINFKIGMSQLNIRTTHSSCPYHIGH